MVNNVSTYINTSEDVLNEIKNDFYSYCDDISKVIQNMVINWNDVAEKHQYKLIIDCLNQIIDIYDDAYLSYVVNIYEKYKDSDISFAHSAASMQLGEAANDQVVMFEESLSDMIQITNVSIDKIGTIPLEDVNFNSIYYDDIMESLKTAWIEVDKIAEYYCTMMLNKMESNLFANKIRYVMIAIYKPLLIFIEKSEKIVEDEKNKYIELGANMLNGVDHKVSTNGSDATETSIKSRYNQNINSSTNIKDTKSKSLNNVTVGRNSPFESQEKRENKPVIINDPKQLRKLLEIEKCKNKIMGNYIKYLNDELDVFYKNYSYKENAIDETIEFTKTMHTVLSSTKASQTKICKKVSKRHYKSKDQSHSKSAVIHESNEKTSNYDPKKLRRQNAIINETKIIDQETELLRNYYNKKSDDVKSIFSIAGGVAKGLVNMVSMVTDMAVGTFVPKGIKNVIGCLGNGFISGKGDKSNNENKSKISSLTSTVFEWLNKENGDNIIQQKFRKLISNHIYNTVELTEYQTALLNIEAGLSNKIPDVEYTPYINDWYVDIVGQRYLNSLHKMNDKNYDTIKRDYVMAKAIIDVRCVPKNKNIGSQVEYFKKYYYKLWEFYEVLLQRNKLNSAFYKRRYISVYNKRLKELNALRLDF